MMEMLHLEQKIPTDCILLKSSYFHNPYRTLNWIGMSTKTND